MHRTVTNRFGCRPDCYGARPARPKGQLLGVKTSRRTEATQGVISGDVQPPPSAPLATWAAASDWSISMRQTNSSYTAVLAPVYSKTIRPFVSANQVVGKPGIGWRVTKPSSTSTG